MTTDVRNEYIKRLRNGEIIQRVITYCGVKLVEHIQLNKKADCICWQRYAMPTNRDKSKAVKWNEYLSLKDVLNILDKKETNVSILVV
jgi:hypothetical protein